MQQLELKNRPYVDYCNCLFSENDLNHLFTEVKKTSFNYLHKIGHKQKHQEYIAQKGVQRAIFARKEKLTQNHFNI